jgi:hypothetical protein
MNLFHRHRLKVTAVKHGVSAEGYGGTCVLMTCDCGQRFDSVSIAGYWTLEDLTPKSTLADHEFLKELGVRV